MKKVISIAICAAIIISAIQIFPVAIAANSPTIICESKKCAPGDSFTLAVELENNPGFNVLELTPVYSDGLTIVNVKNDVENSFFTKGNQYVWALGDNYNGNKLLTLTVEASDELKTGEYSVGFEFRKCENWDKEAVIFAVVSGTVSVTGNSGDCGENASWDFNTESGVLTISGEGEMENYSSSTNPSWYSQKSNIKSVVISDGITSIGNWAFENYTVLTSVTIGNSVTSIGDIAFERCSGLTSVTIPDSVTNIGDWAFTACSGLTSITIPDSVTSIGSHAFLGCTSLTSITIPDSVKEIENGTFYNCSGLKSITIPDNITSIGDEAFYSCNGLTSVTIGNSVTGIGNSAFYGCKRLETIYYTGSEDDWKKISIGSNAIPENTEIVYLVLSGDCGDNVTWSFNTETGVLTISGEGEMEEDYYYSTNPPPWYSQRSSIKSVVISDGITSIGNGAFFDCFSLSSVTIGNSVASIGDDAFYECAELSCVTIPDNVTSIGNWAFVNCTGLTAVTIGNGVTNIDSWAFAGCRELKSVTFGNSVSTIGAFAFQYCDSLESLVLPDSVMIIGDYAFQSCSGLTSVTIPDSVTSIGDDAFEGCTGLTSVTIGSGVTSIGDYAFGYCSGLESITVASGNEKYYSEENCIIEKDTKKLILGCKSSTIPDSVTSIGDGAFYDCSGLTSVTIPDSITSIGEGAFFDCSGLTSVTIPDSITSIGEGAFFGCTGLISVTIGSSVTRIGILAFEGCESLEKIYYLGTKADWEKITIGYDVIPENTEIICSTLSGDCGDNASWELNTESGVLEISGSGEMVAASFGSNSGKIKSVAIGNEITKISSGAFDGLNNLKEVNIFGNPEFEDGAIPDGYTGVIKAFGGTNAQSYCEANGVKFEGLEEYDVAGYQKNLFEENSYRIVSQMRWAEYYDKAGYDIVATLDNGTKRKISVDIKTVYKSIAGKNEKGELITVFSPEDDCYASAIVFTGLPEMSGDEKIIFAFTPYVYNKYSEEKITLDTTYLVYNKDGFSKYVTALKLSSSESDGEEVTWEKFN